MANPGIFKNFKVSGDLSPYRIAALSAKVITQATGPAQALIGTTDEVGKHSNSGADLALSGLPEVECGGAIAPGDALTSDAQGRAVKAAAGNRIIGFALEDGATGVIITYSHNLGFAQ
jgi:hypothetical protein